MPDDKASTGPPESGLSPPRGFAALRRRDAHKPALALSVAPERAGGCALQAQQDFQHLSHAIRRGRIEDLRNLLLNRSMDLFGEEPYTRWDEKTQQRVESTVPSPYGKRNLLHMAVAPSFTHGARDPRRQSVSESDKLQMTLMLLQAGLKKWVNRPDEADRSPLWMATATGKWDMALELLKHGANPNQICKPMGVAPVHMLLRKGLPRGAFTMFLMAGANLDLWSRRRDRSETDLRFLEEHWSRSKQSIPEKANDWTAKWILERDVELSDLRAEWNAWQAHQAIREVTRLADIAGSGLRPL